MKRFHLWLKKDFFDKIQDQMGDYGFTSVGGFIRFGLSRFLLIQELKWSDDDMIAFAQQWAGRKENAPGVLEEPAKQMEREFLQFKKDLLK